MLTPPGCRERMAPLGARCTLDSRELVPGSKNYYRFMCPLGLCPYADRAGGTPVVEVQSRPHRLDGHRRSLGEIEATTKGGSGQRRWQAGRRAEDERRGAVADAV